mgnify:CR=1 FL=1
MLDKRRRDPVSFSFGVSHNKKIISCTGDYLLENAFGALLGIYYLGVFRLKVVKVSGG